MPNNRYQQAVYLQSGSPETENRPADGYSGGQLGSSLTVKDPTAGGAAKGYQLVQADSIMDVAPSAGAVAYWLDSTGYLVTTDVSLAGRGNVAGVFRLAVDLGNICCIQQQGPITDLQHSGTGTPSVAGLIVIPSATDAKADVLAAGTAATYPPLGVSRGAAAGGVFAAELTLQPRRP